MVPDEGITFEGMLKAPGGRGAMDGTVRTEPRPVEPRQEVEAWKASPFSRK